MRHVNLVVCALPLLTAGPLEAGHLAGSFPLDPVELVRGREVPGDEAIAIERYQYRYVFANEQNRNEFIREPERFEIQMGGACGRMGLLSGSGDPDRFALHEGRIYIFASDQCRSTFLRDPAAVLDRDEPPVLMDHATRARALELIERCVGAMGGAERIDGLRSFRQIVECRVESGGAVHVQRDSLSLLLPEGARTDFEWDEKRWTRVESPAGGWYECTDGDRWDMPPVERDAMNRRHHHRHPLSILHARRRPDFAAAHAGPRTLAHGGAIYRLESVTVSYGGCTCTLGIEADTGLLRTVSYLGRRSRVGRVEEVFVEHRDIGGVRVPAAVEQRFDHEPIDGSRVVFTSLAINDPEIERAFERPR